MKTNAADTKPAALSAPLTTTTPRPSLAQVVLAALAFGCTMAFARAFGSGFSGALFAGTAAQMDLVSTVSTAARVVVLIALTALGCLHKSAINRLSLGAAGICMGIGALLLSASALPWLQVATALVCGAGSAFAMFSLMMLLSSRSLKEIIVVSLAGLGVGGILIAASSLLPPPVGTVLFAASGVLSTLGILVADPTLASCVDQGAYSADEFRLFPWFSAIMFVVCGILGALIYGVATTLSWNVMEGVNYPVMGVAAALTIVFSVLVVLAVDNWAQVIWVPLFILLAAILAFVITSGQMLGSITLGLVFALILCYHFLRWMILPALVSTSLLPRFLTGGILLVITNSIFNVGLGARLAEVLPLGMQVPSAFGGVIALILGVVFAFAMFLEHAERQPSEEERLVPAAAYRRDLTAAAPAEAADDAEAVSGQATDDAAPSHEGGERSDAAQAHEQQPEIDAPSEAEPLPVEKTLEDYCAELADAYGLTPREEEVCVMTSRGYSSSYIAEQLYISGSTVRFHQQNLYRKLGVHSKQELINFVEEKMQG